MKVKSVLLCLGLTVSSTASFAVSFETGADLGDCVNLNGVSVSACTTGDGITLIGSANLFAGDFRGVTGVGVAGGVNTEVDEGEALALTLGPANLGIWQSLQLTSLFGVGAGDEGQEFVNVLTSLSSLRGQLAVDAGNLSATWSLFFNDVLVSARPATALDPYPGAGYFEVLDPFEGIAIRALSLDAGAPAGFSNDFAFVAATVTRVPEPSSALLLLIGSGAALAVWRRRSTSSSASCQIAH